jgi:hypothetical protein
MYRSRLLHHSRRTWTSFSSRDGAQIELALRLDSIPPCPCCGDDLELRSRTRLQQTLPCDASGFDVDCRGCRRFWCVVRHTPRSLRLVRMRRLAAAVRAVAPAVPIEAVAG